MNLPAIFNPWGEVTRLRAELAAVRISEREAVNDWWDAVIELHAIKTKLANAKRKEIETKRARRIASDPIITASEQNSGSCDELRGDGA